MTLSTTAAALAAELGSDDQLHALARRGELVDPWTHLVIAAAGCALLVELISLHRVVADWNVAQREALVGAPVILAALIRVVLVVGLVLAGRFVIGAILSIEGAGLVGVSWPVATQFLLGSNRSA